ncbi:MAG: hypothetical protein JW778_01320 [Candidatus Altiarchaeota archaeon]|nr:hypothetical protein [Candidatus Altiarchaeota archaeon]
MEYNKIVYATFAVGLVFVFLSFLLGILAPPSNLIYSGKVLGVFIIAAGLITGGIFSKEQDILRAAMIVSAALLVAGVF